MQLGRTHRSKVEGLIPDPGQICAVLFTSDNIPDTRYRTGHTARRGSPRNYFKATRRMLTRQDRLLVVVFGYFEVRLSRTPLLLNCLPTLHYSSKRFENQVFR